MPLALAELRHGSENEIILTRFVAAPDSDQNPPSLMIPAWTRRASMSVDSLRIACWEPEHQAGVH